MPARFAATLLCATVLAVGGADATPQGACPDVDPDKLSIAPCAQCTAQNFQEGAPLCGYCYRTGTCAEVTVENILTGPCPEPPASPSPGPASAGRVSEEDPKYDYSLGINGDCDCRPDKWTTCEQCATLNNAQCTWISKGHQERTWKLPIPFTKTVVTHEQTVPLNGTCQNVLSPEAQKYELTDADGKLILSLTTESKVDDFYWAQCSMSGDSFAHLLVGVGVVALAATALTCVCCCCKRKRAPVPQRELYYPAPTVETQLLDPQGRPVRVTVVRQQHV